MNAEIDISNVILTTKRLKLRPWELSDLDDLYEYASVDGVGQMAGWWPHENKEESLKVLNHFIDKKVEFALEYHSKVIGSLGIGKYNEKKFQEFKDKKCREIGYVLSKDYWGQGLMSEAVHRVIEYLFEQVRLDVIFCGYFLGNRQSARVQEKCGFHHYSFGKLETRMGTIEDEDINILSKEDYMRENRTYGSVRD